MRVCFNERAFEDYSYFQVNDKKLLRKINDLIKDMQRSPFEGVGKPEPLKHELSGYWSRRIDQKHRLIYSIEDDIIYIIQCRNHYSE